MDELKIERFSDNAGLGLIFIALGLVFVLVTFFIANRITKNSETAQTFSWIAIVIVCGLTVIDGIQTVNDKEKFEIQTASNVAEWAQGKYGVDLKDTQAQGLVDLYYNQDGQTREYVQSLYEKGVTVYGETSISQNGEDMTVRLVKEGEVYKLVEGPSTQNLIELENR